MTTRYRRDPEVRLAAVEGEGVVLQLTTRRYFSVNDSGLALLETLVASQSFDDLVAAVVQRYDVTAADAGASVREFLDGCLTAQLLVIDGDG